MPVPAHLLNAPAYTDSGIPFAWLVNGMKEKAAADANMLALQVLVGWGDSNAWKREAVGYTTWNGASPTLERHLPMADPYGLGLWLDECELLATGVEKGTTQLYDPFYNNAPRQDWVRYQCVFRRPRHWLYTDDVIRDDFSSQEQHRYVERSFRYVPRERRVPAFGFEVDENPEGTASWRRIEETAFLPDYQLEYLFTWKQVPIDAVPFAAYESQLLTVNGSAFKVPGNAETASAAREYEAGTLLFRGISMPLDWYQGADGDFYLDPQIVLAYQPGGWNKQLLRPLGGGGERRYGSVRHHNITPDTPPYASSNFLDLFTPDSA